MNAVKNYFVNNGVNDSAAAAAAEFYVMFEIS